MFAIVLCGELRVGLENKLTAEEIKAGRKMHKLG